MSGHRGLYGEAIYIMRMNVGRQVAEQTEWESVGFPIYSIMFGSISTPKDRIASVIIEGLLLDKGN